jgi:hypothetical protein
VSIQQHQQDTKTRHRVHSTQQPIHATIGTAPFQLNCATHTAILLLRPPKVHTPVTNNVDRIQQHQHIATEPCQTNNINKSRHASPSAFYTATHSHYNRERNYTIFHELRHPNSYPTSLTNIYLSRITSTRSNNNNTSQQSRVNPTISTRYKNASSSAFYTATHTHYNRNGSPSFNLRHSHSNSTSSTNTGPYTCHK